MRRFAASLTTAALLSPYFAGSGSSLERPADIDEARLAIAARYASCTIASVVDRHRPPEPSMANDTPHPDRDAVEVQVDLTDTPEADFYRARYRDNFAVQWYPSGGDAVIRREGANRPTNLPVLTNGIGYFANDWIMHPRFELNPRNDHPANTEMAVFVTTEVLGSAGQGNTLIIGAKYCGMLVKRATIGPHEQLSWTPGPNAPRLPDSITVIQHL